MPKRQVRKNYIIFTITISLLVAVSISSIAYLYASDSTIHIKFGSNFSFTTFTMYDPFTSENETYAYSASEQITADVTTLVKSVNIFIAKQYDISIGEILLNDLLERVNLVSLTETQNYYVLRFTLNYYTYQAADKEFSFKLPRGLKIEYISVTLSTEAKQMTANYSLAHSLSFYYLCDINLDYYSNYFTITSLKFNNTIYNNYETVYQNYMNNYNATTYLNNTYFTNNINAIGNAFQLNVLHYQQLQLSDLLLPEITI